MVEDARAEAGANKPARKRHPADSRRAMGCDGQQAVNAVWQLPSPTLSSIWSSGLLTVNVTLEGEASAGRAAGLANASSVVLDAMMRRILFTNTATLAATNDDTDPANNTSSVSVTVAPYKLYLPLVDKSP
jgi:hypothetical protein